MDISTSSSVMGPGQIATPLPLLHSPGDGPSPSPVPQLLPQPPCPPHGAACLQRCLQAGDTPAVPRGSVACPSPAATPRKKQRGEPVPRPLASAAAAAAGAAGEAAFGGGQRGVFPGQASGQMRAAASWATLSGYLQGEGSPAKHQW